MESSSPLAELAFEQSQRRLDKQERSLAASFLGKEAFGGSGGDRIAVVAAVASS
jgi:hypothetical protein